MTNFPPRTPIDPVIVPGSARIRSAFIATKYPPEAATSPIETTTGFPALRARDTSRQIVSEATYDPPGESTRKTMAATSGSFAALRKAVATLSEPIVHDPVTGL